MEDISFYRKGHSLLDILTRIMIDKYTGCWKWLGRVSPQGYACLGWNGKDALVHRLTYTIYRKDIDSGLQLDHLCRNRFCVNPFHLEEVTMEENIRREHEVRGGLCSKGHPFDRTVGQKQARRCSVCHRNRERRRREKSIRANA